MFEEAEGVSAFRNEKCDAVKTKIKSKRRFMVLVFVSSTTNITNSSLKIAYLTFK